MQSSRVLAFKALTSKIHPQLPLNPRESQQLLTLLTTSFRRQLEKEHPHDPAEECHLREDRHSREEIKKASNDHIIPSSQASAGNVLHSILTNPLFATPRQRSPSPSRISTKLEKGGVDFQRALNEPVEWFENRIAQGTSSLDVARTFLTIVSKLPDSHENHHCKYRAAIVLRDWLWATGLEDSLDFVRNDMFTKHVVHLLVHNGLEQKIWSWIDHVDALRTETYPLDPDGKQALLLVFTSKARMAITNTAEGALTVLFDALERKTRSKSSTTSLKESPIAQLYRYLKRQMIRGAIQPKDVTLFEKFLQVRNYLAKDVDLYHAQLMLVHPSAPNPAPAVSLIRRRYKTTTSSKNPAVLKFLLDTAQVLLSQENYEDLSLVTSLLRDQFSDQLGLTVEPARSDPTNQSSSSSKTETSNLELLDSLSLG